jgi:hypothetical protein
MSRKPEVSENWFEDVCESMVRENLSLRKAAQLNGIALTEIEAQNVSRRLAFQACLKRHEYTYFEELGGDPRRTKHVLLGMMFYGIEKLMAEGAYKDAVSAGLQLAKVEYNTEGEVSGALANLTAAEIAEVKKRIEALALENSKPVEVPKGPVN